jgi:hypothetical protein
LSAAIFNGTAVKILKNILKFKDGTTLASSTIGDIVTHSSPATDNTLPRFDGVGGKTLQTSGITVDDSNNVTGVNDLTVTGNLTVNGTTTTLNVATLEVEDVNILLNKGGTDVSAEGAGIAVYRGGFPDLQGSIVYEDALASKWKLGAAAFEKEVVDVSSTQTLTNKTISGASNTITNLDLFR